MSDRMSVSDNQYYFFYCPGCNRRHVINNKWQWNGDKEKPTFKPSVLVTHPAVPDASEEFKEYRTERRCHSYITDGKIQFLTDSTHGLSGQTVDLPNWDQDRS